MKIEIICMFCFMKKHCLYLMVSQRCVRKVLKILETVTWTMNHLITVFCHSFIWCLFQGLFIGAESGRVYLCGPADDFSQQKVFCVAANLHKLIWRGPQQPVEYKSSCFFDGCYGCFDPVVRHRLFRFKQF